MIMRLHEATSNWSHFIHLRIVVNQLRLRHFFLASNQYSSRLPRRSHFVATPRNDGDQVIISFRDDASIHSCILSLDPWHSLPPIGGS